MSDRRPHISLSTKLASALLELLALRGDPIDFEVARQMTAAQILSLFEFDHATWHVIEGSVHPTNLTPRLILDHRHKTAKIDAPAIAKVRSVVASTEAFYRKMREKSGQAEPVAGISERPKFKRQWPKGRKMQSRPFPKRRSAAP